MARSMVSLGIPTALASVIALRSRAFPEGSAPPLAATMIVLLTLLQSFERFASVAAFLCLMFAHLLWPAIFDRGLGGEFSFPTEINSVGSSKLIEIVGRLSSIVHRLDYRGLGFLVAPLTTFAGSFVLGVLGLSFLTGF